jgi:hypothetical protein
MMTFHSIKEFRPERERGRASIGNHSSQIAGKDFLTRTITNEPEHRQRSKQQAASFRTKELKHRLGEPLLPCLTDQPAAQGRLTIVNRALTLEFEINQKHQVFIREALQLPLPFCAQDACTP